MCGTPDARRVRALPYCVAVAALTALVIASDAAQAVTSTWGGGTGDWDDSTRWDTDPLFPCNGQGGNDYDVVFGSGTVTLTLDCTIDSLTQSGGTVAGGFDLTIDQSYSWTGGTMGGAGTTQVSGGIDLSGTGNKAMDGTRTLVHAGGTGTWSAGNIVLGNDGATLRNETTWNVTGATRSMSDTSNSGSFENSATGTLNVDLDNATRVLTLSPGSIQNDGAMNANLGVLALWGDGTHSGSFAGAGTIRFDGGAQTLGSGASVTVADLEVDAGTLGVDPAASFGPTNTDITGGTLNVTGVADTITSTTATLSTGNLGGAGTFATTGSFAWTGGTMGDAGTTRVGGGLHASGSANKNMDGTRTLIHESGTGSWSLGHISMGDNGATLRNEATWDLTGGTRAMFDSGNTGTFENTATGVVNVDLLDAARVITVSPGNVQNDGTVNANVGVLSFDGDGTHGGSFAGAGTVRFDGGAQVLGTGATVTVADLEVDAGTLDVDPAASFGPTNTDITGGTLNVTGVADTITSTTATLSTGNLGGPGTFATTGSFAWTGGTMGDAGTTRVGGGLHASGSANKNMDGTRTLIHESGTGSWSLGHILMGNDGATLRNETTWNLTGGTRQMSDTGNTATFENTATGTVNVDLLDAARVITVSPGNVQNDGTVNTNLGVLSLNGNGTHGGTFAGTGSVRFSGGAQVLGTGVTVTVADLEVTGATLDVEPAASFGPGNTDITSGALNVTDVADTITSTTATLSGGSLGGPGTFATTGSFAWTGGTMGDSGTTEVNGGLDASGSSNKTLDGTRTLVHAGGTGSWSLGHILMGNDGATLRNETTWNVTGGSRSMSDTGNTGTFENGATGTVNVDLLDPARVITVSPGNVQNDGTVNANLGVLSFDGDGTHGGSFAGAGTVRFDGGAQVLGTGATVTVADLEVTGATLDVEPAASFGPGNTDITSGALNVTDVADTITSTTATLSGGTLGGPGTFETTGSFAWTGGTMGDAGTTRVGGGLHASGSANKNMDGTRTLIHESGTGSWSLGHILMGNDGATLRNETTWNVTGGSRSMSDTSDTATFENTATGTLDVELGSAASTLTISTGAVTNAGAIAIRLGTIDFVADFVQTAGTTRLEGGTIEGPPLLDFDGGALEGAGGVEGDVTMAGTLAPGLSPGLSAGQLDIDGFLTLEPGSAFDVELLGSGRGNEYDSITATDSVTLDGTLSVDILESFRPGVTSDPFIVLEETGGSPLSGTFANIANGERIFTAALDSFVVRYGPGSTTGANRVVLDDYVMFFVNSGLLIGGTAAGGTLTLMIDGVEIVVVLTAGMTPAQVAAAIAAAVNANDTLRQMGIVAITEGDKFLTNGLLTDKTNTDPGITLASPFDVPALTGLGLALALGLLASAGLWARRKHRG